MNKHVGLVRMTTAALCLALCMLLPFLTGQLPQIGGMLSPMHLPVYLCAFLCGPWWAGAVGAVAPLLRHVCFYMPPVLTAISMTFELAAYGIAAGLFFPLFQKLLRRAPHGSFAAIYPAMLAAMLCGRLIWGLTQWGVSAAGATEFSVAAFFSGAFLTAWPGMLTQLLLVPPLVRAVFAAFPETSHGASRKSRQL